MTDPARSAAIWYATDGYDPVKKGLNGRRVAGESFLRGFMQHADVASLQCITNGQTAAKEFARLADPYLRGRPVQNYHLNQTANLEDISTVMFPSPTVASEGWRRFHRSQTAYSICGITHTTATKAVMNGFFEARCAPLEPWDGIICTSKSVYDHVSYQQDLFDDYAGRRFGTKTPTRFNITTIPLGIHTDDFKPDESLGRALRDTQKIGPDDVVFLVLSRLSAHEKFDPIPMYRALRMAQDKTTQKIHLILCGYFPDKLSEDVFKNGAARAMPTISLHLLDGKDAEMRRSAYAASDVFVFPIDNLQETFGLAPVEAMAAGLPLIVSDWDGMKDTVTPDVGFRIPTRMVSPDMTRVVSERYQSDVDTYQQYTSLNASMVQIDIPKMAEKMALLAGDKGLRTKMGAAAQKRAKRQYDWKAIIPMMQNYWGELTAIRQHAQNDDTQRYQGLENPHAPNSGHLFQSYPTVQGQLETTLLRVTRGSSEMSIEKVVETRGYHRIRRQVETTANLKAVYRFFERAENGACLNDVLSETKFPMVLAERAIVFLLKYDLLREV